MFSESCTLGFVNLDLRFLASNYSFIPGRQVRNRRFRSSVLGIKLTRIGMLVWSFVFLVRTSSFPGIISNTHLRDTHRGKDTKRDLFVLEKVWCTKAKLFVLDRKSISVWDRIHFLSTLELIVQKHSFLRNCVRNSCFCIYELTSKSMFRTLKSTFERDMLWYVNPTDFQRTQQIFLNLDVFWHVPLNANLGPLKGSYSIAAVKHELMFHGGMTQAEAALVMSHIWMCHVAHMKESCRAYK